ncbi:hypothetical protein WQ57_04070 [Mesobacillus campisalis]|uniref:Homing endonuclease LAGLIDADG domain-containing protein n=1 Tax=Mesobacillus campisalis TaxID=1408103 RepID=A0A0M2SZ21_9BACI|nr:LAGLIDADG family homing endonuclease [Mesobacillus campisalis]KKK39408.1 hypothetical protein WQ57_04070 [Mesobacillus campisalis]
MKEWESGYVAGIIDGEGTITLSRMHSHEYRRPCISIASTDKELLLYIQSLTGGTICNKRNYNPVKHKDSFTLIIKKDVISLLEQITPYLRVDKKKKRAQWIITHYEHVTARNGKYSQENLVRKIQFEDYFFQI